MDPQPSATAVAVKEENPGPIRDQKKNRKGRGSVLRRRERALKWAAQKAAQNSRLQDYSDPIIILPSFPMNVPAEPAFQPISSTLLLHQAALNVMVNKNSVGATMADRKVAPPNRPDGDQANISPGGQTSGNQNQKHQNTLYSRPNKNEQPLKIDHNSLITPRIKAMISSKDYWHKFIILGGAAYEKTVNLKTVLNCGYCTEFIPVMYRLEPPHATFLARGCTSAIAKIHNNKFRLALDGYKASEKTVFLEIILCFSHISILGLSVHDTLTKCVNKRFDKKTRTMDLSDFANDPDLVELFYCPLWLPRVYNYVLLKVKSLDKAVSTLLLNKNELTSVKGINNWEGFGLVRSLDISDNKLEGVYCLKGLQGLKLRDLVVHDNPFCANYSGADSYMRDVRSYVPLLKTLDGVELKDCGIPCWLRNYVISPEGGEFVEQFLERYFTLFDSENRQCLQGLYHEDACFSMSANYLGGQSTSSTARLTLYTMESRNLLKISDYTKSFKLISHGPEDIIGALGRLPKTEHDPYSLSVDLVQYAGNQVVFTVSGMYREPSMMKKALIRFFNRTFVLTKIGHLTYQISNEILYISNATTRQAKEAFKYPLPPPNMTWIALTAFEQLTDENRQVMTNFMAELTCMNPRWAKKCLEESKWKFREALQVFTELLKMDKIPSEAFQTVK